MEIKNKFLTTFKHLGNGIFVKIVDDVFSGKTEKVGPFYRRAMTHEEHEDPAGITVYEPEDFTFLRFVPIEEK